MTVRPRLRNVATLCAVAGLVHMRVCMAGARTTGAPVVRIVAVSMSSARPAATLASRSAEAGATRVSNASIDGLTVRLHSAGGFPGEAVRAIEAAGAAVEDIETSKASLEDVFLALTGRAMRERN